MFFRAWDILIVDDEPDVINITQLALKNMEVFGLPVRLITASSKAEAIEKLKATQWPATSGIAAAFIDVVMESDTAGLELCRFIREDMHNKFSQLYIRTGQPGIAPERSVIDGYDINGYFTKTEATSDKLYTLVKSGVRQYWWSTWALGVSDILIMLMENMNSKEAVTNMYAHFVQSYEDSDLSYYVRVNDQTISLINWNEESARAKEAELNKLVGISLNEYGDKVVTTEDKFHLYKIQGREGKANITIVHQSPFIQPEPVTRALSQMVIGLSTAYANAG